MRFLVAWTTAGGKAITVALRALTIALLLAAALPCAAQSDTTPPTVAIVSPPSGATLCGTVPIVARASDDVGVVGVQFKHDGMDIGAEKTTAPYAVRSEEHTSELQSHHDLVCRLLLEKKKKKQKEL